MNVSFNYTNNRKFKKRRRGSEKENDQQFFNKVLYIFLKLIIFYVENLIFFFVLKKCCFRDFPSTLQIHLFKAIEFLCINFYWRNFGIFLFPEFCNFHVHFFISKAVAVEKSFKIRIIFSKICSSSYFETRVNPSTFRKQDVEFLKKY